jgi:hypothetical protein
MVPKKIFTIYNRKNAQYWKLISLNEIWSTWSQKELAKPRSQILNIYFIKDNTNFKGLSM